MAEEAKQPTTPESKPVVAAEQADAKQAPQEVEGKVYVPDPKPAPTKAAPPELKLTPEVSQIMESLGATPDEGGLKAVLGWVAQAAQSQIKAQKKVKEKETVEKLGDAKSRIREQVHNAVEANLAEFEGLKDRPDTKQVLKAVAWAVTDAILPMSAAISQAHTAEELGKYDQEQQKLLEMYKDPANKIFMDQAYKIRDLAKKLQIPPEYIATVARELLPEDFGNNAVRDDSPEPRRRAATRGAMESGRGYAGKEADIYAQAEKAMDALMEKGESPSAIFKKHRNLF